jgi:hypothetical protein
VRNRFVGRFDRSQDRPGEHQNRADDDSRGNDGGLRRPPGFGRKSSPARDRRSSEALLFQLAAGPMVIEVCVPVNFNRTSASEMERVIRHDEVDLVIVAVNEEVAHHLSSFLVSPLFVF